MGLSDVGAIPVPLNAARVLGTANQITATPSGASVTLSIVSGRGLMRQGLADGTAILAATPDFDGQLLVALDGYMGVGTGTGAGNVAPFFLATASTTYALADLQLNGFDFGIDGGRINAATNSTSGSHRLTVVAGSFVDNVLDVQNLSTGGYSAFAFWHPGDTLGAGRQLAIGMAPNNGSGQANMGYFETNADPTTNAAPDMLFSQFANTSGAGDFGHRRLYFDGTNRTTTLYGWTNGAAIGPVGLHINADGNVALGTSTINTMLALGGRVFVLESATDYPSFSLIRTSGRRWDIGMGDSGASYSFLLVNGTASTIPFSVHGTAPGDSLAVGATGTVNILAGGSTSTASVGGTLATDTTTTGNVGTGEDTLQTYTVPAATLSVNGHTIRFTASGTIASTVNAKRIRVKFGATTLFDTGAAGIPISAAFNWTIEGEIIRTGAATQKCNAKMNTSNATLASYVGYSPAAETLSGAVVLLITGEAVSNNDIVKETFKVMFEQ